jgi:cell division protein FtsW
MQRKTVFFLVLAVVAILVLGIVMLFSTSAYAKDAHGDPFYFVKRQSVWLSVGAVACVLGAVTDYHFWRRTCWIWFGLSAVLLALCFVPHIGMRINGASRWVGHGSFRFQPSDFAKFSCVAVLAWWFSTYEIEPGDILKGFIYPMGIIGVLMALIAREIDMGTTALLGGTMFVVMFVAGTGLRFLVPVTLMGLTSIIYIGSHLKGRSERLLAFLDLEKYKDGAGLQQWEALIAFGSGGTEGLGLGNGVEKMQYLPFAHTDFIFPMIGEELGLRFTLFVVFCFIVIIICGTVIAIQARDRFGMLLGFGIVTMISLQAALNIGVTTALLPNKGLPLPFISYGGSNLAFCMLCMGILINIYRQGIAEKPMDKTTTKLRARVTPRI